MLVSQHRHIYVKESLKEYHLCVHSYSSNSAPHILFCLECLWDGRKVAVLLLFCWLLLPGFVQDSMQHSSHLAVSLFVLSVSKLCIHTIVLTQLQCGRNPILFYPIDQISIWSINCILFFQLVRCCCQSI